jgi:fucose 4-O-acetylase-like acetyltransferase
MECLQFTANITTFVPVMAFRNQTISICKGIAIILMVIGHADCPGLLGRFLYEFHMPLFFITAGYFFNLKYLNDEKTFVVKRLKGLYLPFLKWSILFTLLHNVFFKLNIINDQFGNGTKGGVAHLYSWHDIQRNILYSVTQMGGYDVFLNGAFWFFRALLISSIAYLVLFKLLRKNSWLRCENAHIAANRTGITVCLVMLLWAAWKTGCNLPITNIPQGGYRELMGTFFFGVGFLLHENPRFLHTTWWTCAGCFAIVLGFSVWLTADMSWFSSFDHFLKLPVPAIAGFIMTYHLSSAIEKRHNIIRRFLVYCGDNTLPIFVFHILSYKVVSLIKIAYYGLDFKQIGCHMVVHEFAQQDYFWVLYTVAGVGLPLLGHYLVKKHTMSRS